MNSLFHPPQSFITEGGQEDFYMHEMNKLVAGVELDNSMEIVGQELDPDGIDYQSTQSASEDSETNQLNYAS